MYLSGSVAMRFKAKQFKEKIVGIELNFEGKIAMVTGASSGLGARFAKVLAQGGAQVVLASRRTERLKELRAEIEAEGGAAHVVSLDVTDYASIKAAIAHAETEAGPIDILVNNSGVSTTQRLIDVTPDDYAYVMDTNQRGAFFVAQEAAKRMIARAKGDPKKQHRIINIASVAGLRVLPQIGIYCVSKAAVVHMTKSMAVEWGRYNINVNAICPGYISTEINAEHFQSEQGKALVNMLPRKRVGEPQDLDGLLLLLASDEAHFINGAIMTADDGMSAS
ncbi:NAD(P)-dependent dehydrogenase, short-chain alcohol dehydrogenase family [Noviherbaspirillum suwonense]|jgi:NAD(P)-dependent dehydrogenase (short-subunit alcohol dehydrogenase family)|uniref:NAD(P)-dependent dehydrogenase, short-chain alcohol dehydrogenase family n=2 Tax=Pseudomonadota TaxID=1224 RepID=A0ABY1Q026_9BURK|nr:NAD(P)-dependent dehydrogenase, short-chain alcohol dehydrogenase family [Noviherbaspirillum suwonense]